MIQRELRSRSPAMMRPSGHENAKDGGDAWVEVITEKTEAYCCFVELNASTEAHTHDTLLSTRQQYQCFALHLLTTPLESIQKKL